MVFLGTVQKLQYYKRHRWFAPVIGNFQIWISNWHIRLYVGISYCTNASMFLEFAWCKWYMKHNLILYSPAQDNAMYCMESRHKVYSPFYKIVLESFTQITTDKSDTPRSFSADHVLHLTEAAQMWLELLDILSILRERGTTQYRTWSAKR